MEYQYADMMIYQRQTSNIYLTLEVLKSTIDEAVQTKLLLTVDGWDCTKYTISAL